VQFTASGDFAANAQTTAVLDQVNALDPDLHLALGDLSYGATGQEQAWCDLVLSRVGAGFPFQLLAGNHESNGQNGNINDFSACLPNQLPGLVGTYGREWYVDVPQVDPVVRFVMISPNVPFTTIGNWSYAAGTSHYTWTAAAIDAARAASIPWVVVGMHKPCLSIGQYQCEPGTDIIDLLLDKDVDLVLSGHEHLYQRTHQLSRSADCPSIVPGATANPACLADTDSAYAKGAGTVFATIGTGGVALRDVFTADPEAGYFAASSGQNSNPTWGSLNVTATATTLTAGFAPATGGTFTDGFTIAPAGPPGNGAPTARMVTSCNGLTCTFDAAPSSDADGTITGHGWTLGDGTVATTPTVTHTYAATGVYPVTLTVTDDDGATGSTSSTVTPSAPTTSLATDAFGRTVPTGWGSADGGGPWTVTGNAANYSVPTGTGRIRANGGTGQSATLNQISSAATDLAFTIATDRPITGSGLYLAAIGRKVPGAGEYRAKVRLNATGSVGLSLVRTTATGTEVSIQPETTIAGLTYAVGDRITVRVQVAGTAPTTIRAKVWKQGTPEPATWPRSVTDSTAALQNPGAVGVNYYLSSTATNAPIAITIDDLRADRL
jgi:3',5'-cyclic AMP phosphodiesterase CpdA